MLMTGSYGEGQEVVDMDLNRKNKGWYNEPTRHSLAAQGVLTSLGKSSIADFKQQYKRKYEEKIIPPSDFYPINYYRLKEVDNTEVKKLIKLFWWSNFYDDYSHIDFGKAFENIHTAVDSWLMYNIRHYLPKSTKSVCATLSVSEDEVIDLVDERKYDELREKLGLDESRFNEDEKWSDLFSDMLNLAHRLDNRYGTSLPEKVNLLDNIIHQQHLRSKKEGDSWMGIDVEKLRNNFEEEYT